MKKLSMILIMKELSFLCWKKNLTKLKRKTKFASMFCYENKLIFPIYIPDHKLGNSMDLLLIFDGDKSHCLYIKDFGRFMLQKTKNKNKKYFCKSCLQ